MCRSPQIRILLLLATGLMGATMLLFSVHYRVRPPAGLSIVFGATIGLTLLTLWPGLLRFLLLPGWVIIFLGLMLDVRQSWARGEIFLGVCFGALILFGIVRLVRERRFQQQFQGAKLWPLTRGRCSGNYEDGSQRVVYYGYEVAGSYYSGSVVAGSTLELRLKSQLDALKGTPAFIRYKPDEPEISTLLKSDQIELPV